MSALGNRGLVLVKLKEQDRLKYFCFTREDEEVAIATSGGRILRLPVNDVQIPVMGRNAQGNRVMRLRLKETLVGCCAVTPQDSLILISQLGYGKRIPVNSLRLANRGDIGTQAIQFTSKEDSLAGIISMRSLDNITLTTTIERRLIFPIDHLPVANKNSTGEKIGKLKPDEAIVGVYPFGK